MNIELTLKYILGVSTLCLLCMSMSVTMIAADFSRAANNMVICLKDNNEYMECKEITGYIPLGE